MKKFVHILTLIMVAVLFSDPIISRVHGSDSDLKIVFVTYVADFEQERKAAVLIESIRKWGGAYRNCPIYVVQGDPINIPSRSLAGEGVQFLPVDMDKSAIGYPLAIKAYAAAQVEEHVKNQTHTLAWFDPETMVLGSLEDLDLKGRLSVALRPVFLVNNIGLGPTEESNAYWQSIYKGAGLLGKKIPIVEAISDGKKIKAYFNCEVISVDPKLGLFKKWALLLTKLLNDSQYQKLTCAGFLQKLFLHQAVLSAVIVANVDPAKMHWLPLTCAYPMNLHRRLPDEKKVSSLNSLSSIILEDVWNSDPNWMKVFKIEEPLKSWLNETYIDFLRITNNIYRIEGSCNAYLVVNEEGSTLIDPAGAMIAPQWFEAIINDHPLKAILLTHGHKDHSDTIAYWKKNQPIPVVAQNEFIEFVHYQNRLAGFFFRRNAIWQGESVQKEVVYEGNLPITPTIFFTDRYYYEMGGLRFNLVHTSGETPDHSIIWIPEEKAVFIGDNYYTSFPNLYTLRGTKPRWALDYIFALDKTLELQPEYLCVGHGAPLRGKANIATQLKMYRDAIQYVHDETVKGINEGKDVFTLMHEITLPPQYQGIGQFYGRVSWAIRGIYEGYIGWFDENPATMYDQPISSIYPDIIEISGGADALLKLAKEQLKNNEYVKVLHLTDVVLAVDLYNKAALEIRNKAIKSLRAESRNYIENIWLDYGIKKTE